jgi:tetratricopeptide (TPR) repeat protein
MKGERRHELERNELADWLAKTFETIKPYQNAILATVLLVLVGTVAYSWWARQSAGRQVGGWDAFHGALWELAQGTASPTGVAADFEAIVDRYPDRDVALWARIMAADLHLAIGCDELFHNKGIANQELRKAEDHYLTILHANNSNSDLRERATFGLARARESQGNLQKAMEHYQEVERNWPEGAYAAAAASRLADLKRADTQRLYDRFAKFDPKPVSSQLPDVPSQPPAFDVDSLPDDGTLFEPKLLDLEEKGAADRQPQGSPEKPAKPADAQPGGGDTGTAGPASTDTKPSDTGASDPGAATTEAPEREKTDADKPDPADAAEPSLEKSD